MLHKCRRYGQMGLAFAVLAFLSMILSGIFRSSAYAQYYFGSDISKNAMAVRITHSESDIEPFLAYLLQDKNVKAIHKVFPFSDVEAVWARETAGKDFPVVGGRNFTVEDLASKERLAVVGKERIKREEKKTGSSAVVYFDNQPYRVIGVAGDPNKESYLDDVLYVNLFSLTERKAVSSDGEYIFDFYSQPSSFAFMAWLKGHLADEHVRIERVPISSYRIDVANVLKDDDFVRLLTTTVIIVVISSFCIAISWIQKRASEIQTRKRVGASDAKILFYLFLRFFIVGIFVFLIVFAIYANVHSTFMERLNYAHAALDFKLAFLFYLLCNFATFLGSLPCMFVLRSIRLVSREFRL